MAKAKRCERCGAFYEIRDDADAQLQSMFTELQIRRMIKEKQNTKLYMAVIGAAFDLCPACMKSLKKWMRIKEETE